MAKSKNPNPSIHAAEMATHYGFALAFMNSDPELKKLFNQAVKNTWTTEKFVSQLRNTTWFKTHSAAVRNGIMQKTADPATWKQNVDAMKATVSNEWEKMFGTATQVPGQLDKWAETAQMMGWSEAQLMDHMISGVKLSSLLTSKNVGGTAADSQMQIQQLAKQYGLNMGQSWITNRVGSVLDGSATIGGIQAQLKNMAKQTYTAYADQLDAGQTMKDIASPYIQQMSSLLETNPNAIGVDNPLIQRALTNKNKQTGKADPLNLADFSDMVRQDPRWQYTDNAMQQVASTTHNLLQSFGLSV